MLNDIAEANRIILDREETRVICLRQALQSITCRNIISFMTRMNMRTVLAAGNLQKNIIVSERSYPPSMPLPMPEEQRRRVIYPLADAVVVQTQYTKTFWAEKFLAPAAVKVIPNVLTAFSGEYPLRCYVPVRYPGDNPTPHSALSLL
jgi:hypothetical protein